mgnify:CR=1
MKNLKTLLALTAGIFLLAAGTTATGATQSADSSSGATVSSSNPYFNSWGTCRNSKPFKPPQRFCRYDRGQWFRGTFVLKTKPGNKVMMKACFRIYSRAPLGGKHGCGQSLQPLKYKAFPFYVRGARQAFKVRIIWYAKGAGTSAKFTRAGQSWMTVRP